MFATIRRLRKTVSKFRGKGLEKTECNDGIPSDFRKRTKPPASSRFYTSVCTKLFKVFINFSTSKILT